MPRSAPACQASWEWGSARDPKEYIRPFIDIGLSRFIPSAAVPRETPPVSRRSPCRWRGPDPMVVRPARRGRAFVSSARLGKRGSTCRDTGHPDAGRRPFRIPLGPSDPQRRRRDQECGQTPPRSDARPLRAWGQSLHATSGTRENPARGKLPVGNEIDRIEIAKPAQLHTVHRRQHQPGELG